MENSDIEEILEAYRGEEALPQEEIVAMLREIQEKLGCIPWDAREAAAEAAGVKQSVIDTIIRLYPSLKPAPYRHRLIVCQGKSCGFKGGRAVLEAVYRELNPDKNGLSADGQFLVETTSCLKQCRTAPNLSLDGRIYTSVQAEDVKKIIAGARKP